MKCRQSATLMITIIGGVHEDQQIALGRGLLQRGMEHGHRDATLAGPGQYADRAAAAAAQAEGHCVWGVVQPALRDTPARSATSCAVALRATLPPRAPAFQQLYAATRMRH